MQKYLVRLPVMLSVAASLFANSGTGATTLTQRTFHCSTFSCDNAKLDDGELFSYSIATSPNARPTQLTFRGRTYFDLTFTCGVSAWLSCATSQTITANNGQYVVHETLQLRCVHSGCFTTNLSGSFTLNNEVFSLSPTTFGGAGGFPHYGPGPLTGTGQVELAVKFGTDKTVRLESTDPSITVPVEVTITAGAFVADFTVNAVGIQNGNLSTTAKITAMFPSGYTADVAVTDNPLPRPPK